MNLFYIDILVFGLLQKGFSFFEDFQVLRGILRETGFLVIRIKKLD